MGWAKALAAGTHTLPHLQLRRPTALPCGFKGESD